MKIGDRVRYQEGCGRPGEGVIVGWLESRRYRPLLWAIVQWSDRRSACSVSSLELVP